MRQDYATQTEGNSAQQVNEPVAAENQMASAATGTGRPTGTGNKSLTGEQLTNPNSFQDASIKNKFLWRRYQ